MSQFIIGSKHKVTGVFSMSTNPKIQTDYRVAVTEAQRLATLDSSKKFIVLEVKDVLFTKDIVRSNII